MFLEYTADAASATEFTINSAGELVATISGDFAWYGSGEGNSFIIVTSVGLGAALDAVPMLCSVSGVQLLCNIPGPFATCSSGLIVYWVSNYDLPDSCVGPQVATLGITTA